MYIVNISSNLPAVCVSRWCSRFHKELSKNQQLKVCSYKLYSWPKLYFYLYIILFLTQVDVIGLKEFCLLVFILKLHVLYLAHFLSSGHTCVVLSESIDTCLNWTKNTNLYPGIQSIVSPKNCKLCLVIKNTNGPLCVSLKHKSKLWWPIGIWTSLRILFFVNNLCKIQVNKYWIFFTEECLFSKTVSIKIFFFVISVSLHFVH